MSTCWLNWRIGLDAILLERGFFHRLGIEPPTAFDYKEYSEIVGNARGRKGAHGFIHATMTWTNMTPKGLYKLRRLVDQAREEYGGVIYMTVNRMNGQGGVGDWIDLSAFIHPLVVTPLGDLAGGSGTGAESVVLEINDITIINAPSTVE